MVLQTTRYVPATGTAIDVTGRLTDQLLLAPPLLSDVSQLMKVGAFELILCVALR